MPKLGTCVDVLVKVKFTLYRIIIIGPEIINPTQKRTEGRAPVWGFEFTKKAALAEATAGLNV